MEELWEQITQLMRDTYDDSPVCTKAVLIIETVHEDGNRRLNRISMDAAQGKLRPWEVSGMLASTYAEVIDAQGKDQEAGG